MEHFIKHFNPSPKNTVVLILDGHSSHKTTEYLELAKKLGVILLCLPPHCKYRLQPLNVSIFGPTDTFYDGEI